MNITVCIKQVPDVPSIRIDKERMTIIRDGVESIINPVDCVALEAALNLRDEEGGRITVLSMGPPQSEEALREAMAAGADEAILITDPALAGADTLATSHVMARAICKLKPFPDLILCGNQTIDSDTGHVGPQLAEELDLPQVCGINHIKIDGSHYIVKKLNDGFMDTLRISSPALLTVSHELCIPHHTPLGDIENAFSNLHVIHWSLKELDLIKEEVGLMGSATKIWDLKKPPPRRKGESVSGTPQDLVKILIDKLKALSILDEGGGNG